MIVVLALAALGAPAGDAGAAQQPPAAGPAARPLAKPAEVRRYWTPRRLRQAIPLGTAAATPSPLARTKAASPPQRRRHHRHHRHHRRIHKRVKRVGKYPFRASGRVYFSEGPNDYVCSGTSVRAGSQSLVWTAGHCVYEQVGLFRGYVTNWEFIPALKGGRHPFGEWPAVSLATTPQFRAGGSLLSGGASGFDFGAATVDRRGGRTLRSVVGSRKIAFHTKPRKGRLHAFGYPASPPPRSFTGRQLFRCDSKLLRRDRSIDGPNPLGIGCDMTGGASGGGWVDDRGRIVSVTSYGYSNRPGVLFGPYQGAVAEQLYASVAGG